MTQIEALIQLLADCAQKLGMGDHSYIVGGAPRDYLLGYEVKDIDVVVEGRGENTATTLATAVAKILGVGCHPDYYGVVHVGPIHHHVVYKGVDLQGVKVEIVAARKEKYDRSRTRDSHKPTQVSPGNIVDDLLRRDFTINTLTWRLSDLTRGTVNAPVLDILGKGRDDLINKVLRTPLNPVDTFEDDPSRMLRAIRFAIKYSAVIESETYKAIEQHSEALRRLPFEVIADVFIGKILTMETAQVHQSLHLLRFVGLLPHVVGMLPAGRIRRAVSGRITDPGLILELAACGFDTGVRFTPEQLTSLRELRNQMSEEDFAQLYNQFRSPLLVERFKEATGLDGADIGRAIEYARELVLQGLTPEVVYTNTLEKYKAMSEFTVTAEQRQTRAAQSLTLKTTIPSLVEQARRIQTLASKIDGHFVAALAKLESADLEKVDPSMMAAFVLAISEASDLLNTVAETVEQISDVACEVENGANTQLGQQA